MREFPKIDAKYRRSYFVGLGIFCWMLALPGTAAGFGRLGFLARYWLFLGMVQRCKFAKRLLFVRSFVFVAAVAFVQRGPCGAH